jgi:ribonuclease P protein component
LRRGAGRAAIASRPSKQPDRAAQEFPRAARLQRRSDFEAVYRSGRRRSSARFVIFYQTNGGPQSRFGSSVKKAVGNAVVRNRIRRRIREILRRNSSEIPSGWDLVIHPRRSVAQAAFAPLEAELLGLLRNLAG